MQEAITADLVGYGVPFFDVRPDLLEEDDEVGETAKVGLSMNAARKASGKVGKVELTQLQRRMIQHLEDMYKD